ncbi:MAG: plastocyanin/azurin family copper-binding protein [Candidatus Limnocylindrales bacterium]
MAERRLPVLGIGFLAAGLVVLLVGAIVGGGSLASGAAGGDAMGQMMGRALAGAGGQPVTPSAATALGNAAPAGATVDRAANRITFQTTTVQLAALGSPADGPDMTFRIAGLADPTLVVPVGATVTVQFVNADSDTSHGWLLTAAQPPFSFMAMMATPVVFPGAFAPPLGDPTAAGLPSETVSFTAATAGTYTYLCPVPGHAAAGMYGALVVTGV